MAARRETRRKRRGRAARGDGDLAASSREALLERAGASRPASPRRRGGDAFALPSDYLARTRGLPVNLAVLAPLFLLYLGCWAWAGSAIETEAAARLRTLIGLLGRRGLLIVSLCTCLALLAALLARGRAAKADAPVIPWMLAEGAAYGMCLWAAASALATVLPVGRWIGLFRLPNAGDVRGFGIALGAGIFEELVFRGVLCYGVYRALRAVFGADRWSAGAVAVVLSAWTFSAYHHWGLGGEPWDAAKFTFRFHAGALLGVVFLGRGLAIAVIAHGLYDALVLLG